MVPTVYAPAPVEVRVGRRGRRWLQQVIDRVDDAYRDIAEIRAGDPLARRFASFGPGSRIEAPRVAVGNPGAVALGAGVYIRAHVCIEAMAPAGKIVLRFGDRVQVGYYCRFVALNGIDIGEDAGIGHGTTVADTVHEWKGRGETGGWQAPLKLGQPLRIEPGAWIGNYNVVTGGITVGAGAITTPNSVINRNVPPDTIVAGNPAQVIRRKGADGEWEWLIDPATLDLETQTAVAAAVPPPRP